MVRIRCRGYEVEQQFFSQFRGLGDDHLWLPVVEGLRTKARLLDAAVLFGDRAGFGAWDFTRGVLNDAMNSYFSPGDWAIIFVYLAGIIGLGLWFGKDQHNTRDYFLGSKNVPWWGIGLSIVAAETSALTIIGVPSMAYGGNLALMH